MLRATAAACDNSAHYGATKTSQAKGRSGIHVASYWTDALPSKELERKLHEAVRLARARLETAKK